MAARGWGLFSIYIYKENLKNLLVRNHWTDFHIILQKCSFGDPPPRLFKLFGFVKKHGPQGTGLIFPIYLYRKIKNLLVRNQWTNFNSSIGFIKKHGHRGGGAGLIFPIYLYRKLKKSSCQKPLDWFPYNFAEMFLFVILYQDCSSHLDSSENMTARGRGLFSLYIYIKNLKNLPVRNHWTDCRIVLQKCSFGDPLPRLFKPLGFVKKHGRQGAGLIFPLYLYRKLKKSSCQKPLNRFPYYFAEMFLWWSSTKIVQAIRICQKTWPPGSGLFSYISI